MYKIFNKNLVFLMFFVKSNFEILKISSVIVSMIK